MKFIDLLNEEARIFKHPNEDEKKRVKTIFKALRKGSVNINYPNYGDSYNVKYHINNNVFYTWEVYSGMYYMVIITNNLPGEGMTVYCKDKEVMNDVKFRERFIMDLRQKFDKFDVNIHVNQKGINFVLDEPKDELNEGAEVLNPESLTDKQINKVKLVYNTFKKGHFVYDQLSTYGYELPDDYYIYKDELGDVCVKLDKEDTDKLYMFTKILSHEIELLPHHDGLHRWVKERVIKKFDGFNIKFIF
jgi:hypothetical protein